MIEHTAYGQQAEFFVVLADRADLSPAANLPTKTEKGRFVYQTLREKAQTTQGPILEWLRERNIEHQSFYIVNAILVKGTREIAAALAARPDVARVEGNPQSTIIFPSRASRNRPCNRLRRAPATIEPGIQYTHAPDVWALGFMGEGIVVASADTGVRWTHNALKPHYRGWDGVRTPTTILTGMTPSMQVAARADMIRLSLATISPMAPYHRHNDRRRWRRQPNRHGARRKVDRLP